MNNTTFGFLDTYVSTYYEINQAKEKLERDIYEYLKTILIEDLADYAKSNTLKENNSHSKPDKRRSFAVAAVVSKEYAEKIKDIELGICYREDTNDASPFVYVIVKFKKQSDYKKFFEILPEEAEPDYPDSEKYAWDNEDDNKLIAEIRYDEEYSTVKKLEDVKNHALFLVKRVFMDFDRYVCGVKI